MDIEGAFSHLDRYFWLKPDGFMLVLPRKPDGVPFLDTSGHVE